MVENWKFEVIDMDGTGIDKVLGYPQATCRFSALLTTSAHAALPQPQIFVIRKLHKALNNLNPYEILCQYFNRPICKQP